VLRGLAEFEKELIRARTAEGRRTRAGKGARRKLWSWLTANDASICIQRDRNDGLYSRMTE
jgi:hypothetical protein